MGVNLYGNEKYIEDNITQCKVFEDYPDTFKNLMGNWVVNGGVRWVGGGIFSEKTMGEFSHWHKKYGVNHPFFLPLFKTAFLWSFMSHVRCWMCCRLQTSEAISLSVAIIYLSILQEENLCLVLFIATATG